MTDLRVAETNRAGRDGKTAVCILYHSSWDAVCMCYMLKRDAEGQQRVMTLSMT